MLLRSFLPLSLLWLRATTADNSVKLDSNAQDLLSQSMSFMDAHYDPSAGYMFSLDIALLHETRSSSWYAAGLLVRNSNDGDDREQAIKIINNIIAPQFSNASEQWYGDYQNYPEQPYPGTQEYPASIYNTWDPNWRGFIGTAFIVILEEFDHLLPEELKEKMVRSLHLTAVGDTYRVGGVDDDNLYPAYSNAAIMHAGVASWVGHRTGDKNLTAEGERWARDIVDLFDRNQTLSEFNGPTYAGISLYALTLWAKYLPSTSILGANGGRMITAVWDSVAEMYNAKMKNIAGPWDRSYGYDMNRYMSIMGLWIWSIVGVDEAPVWKRNPATVAHVDDFEIGGLISILSNYHRQFVSDHALNSLTEFQGSRLVHRTAYSPPYDNVPRNITTWVSGDLMIGAQSFNENVIGGPSINPSQFNPVAVQWQRKDGYIGFLSLYPEVQVLQASVTEGRLNLTYPHGSSTSHFTFRISPNGLSGPKNVRGWEDILGVRVNVSGTVDISPQIAFCGSRGGSCEPVNEFELWNFTYSMPPGSQATPNIVLDFEVV
ncbi:hypothetical protein L218DRAFT_956528 [Marasmius fiardii PR-910]|nr:hypothetical protein L218DRAFT_956528 [Marasmius fiardii PR-910]